MCVSFGKSVVKNKACCEETHVPIETKSVRTAAAHKTRMCSRLLAVRIH